MQLRKYLTIFSLSLAISGCSLLQSKPPEKIVVTETEYLGCEIEIQPRPTPVKLDNVYWYVVTRENFAEFEAKFLERNDEMVFYAISVPDYEDLSLNVAELKRFIQQQKSLIVFYEENISDQNQEIINNNTQ